MDARDKRGHDAERLGKRCRRGRVAFPRALYLTDDRRAQFLQLSKLVGRREALFV
jgi:hypothetical protein